MMWQGEVLAPTCLLADSGMCQECTINIAPIEYSPRQIQMLGRALFMAARIEKVDEEKVDEARRLLYLGASPNWEHPDRNTALHEAVWSGSLEMVKLLVDCGARIDSDKSNGNFTPLHTAAAHGHKEVTRFLLSKGASVEAVSSVGETPADTAQRRHQAEVLKILAEHGHRPTSRAPQRGGYRGAPPQDTSHVAPSQDTSQEAPPPETSQEAPPQDTSQGAPPPDTSQEAPPPDTSQEAPPPATSQEAPPQDTSQEAPPQDT
eukprot:Hpha_TRINITY_DN16681_c1_g1::TRINITY_DN16681_c1_g1_i3::g.181206::m.181206